MRYPVLLLSFAVIISLLLSGCVEEPQNEVVATTVVTSTATATPATETPAVAGPVVISGSGSNVHTFTAITAGPYVMEASAQQSAGTTLGDFIVSITDSSGNSYSGTGNGIVFDQLAEPSYRGTKTVQLAARKYIVTVDSHCDYHIVITRA